jgi:multidrug efflux pump subunit AcrA (membrane-fusion protein)
MSSPPIRPPAVIVTSPPKPAPRRRAWKGRVAAALVVIVALALVCFGGGRHPARAGVATSPVHYESLHPNVVARGELEPAETTDIVCRVRSWTRGSTNSTTIKWVIEDGTPVKQGQLLVELDDSGLLEDLQARKAPLEMAHADWVFAEEKLKIVASQNDSDIRSAEVAVRLADLDLGKYVKGDFEQARKDVHSRLSMAESDLEMCRDRVSWTEHMVKKGYLSAGQARTEEARLLASRMALDKVAEEARVLEKYTRKRTQRELEGRLVELREELERVRVRARAKAAQADADRLAKQRIYLRRLSRYQEVEDEVKKCTITAPHDGLVVYAGSNQAWGGSGAQTSLIAQGEPVREGQRLMCLPNLAHMQVLLRIHEALVARIHGEAWRPTGFGECVQAALCALPDPAACLLAQTAFGELRENFRERDRVRTYGGQSALVRVDAFPEQPLHGHVQTVAAMASAMDWSLPDVRVYQTQIALDEPVPGLKPDMSAQVTISLDEPSANVLAVPVQALVHSPEQGKHCTCFVQTPLGPEERDVVVGMHTEQLAEVQSGLREGEEVVLDPQPIVAERGKGDAGEEGHKVVGH